VLRQVLAHIPPLVNLAALHYSFAENTHYSGAQCFGSVHHHQIPPLRIQPSIDQICMTLDVYAQALTPAKRAAHVKLVGLIQPAAETAIGLSWFHAEDGVAVSS